LLRDVLLAGLGEWMVACMLPKPSPALTVIRKKIAHGASHSYQKHSLLRVNVAFVEGDNSCECV